MSGCSCSCSPTADAAIRGPSRQRLQAAGVEGAVYEDANDPQGIAILSLTKDPNFFLDAMRPVLNSQAVRVADGEARVHDARPHLCAGLRARPAEAILHRPRRTVLNKDWPWAVWYPLRRSGRFAQLPPEEQRVILAEHGAIGMSYGAGDYAHDIRLACYGLDKNDNDFVIGLLGKDALSPLAHRPGDEEDPADVVVSGPARAVLRRPGCLAV